MRVNSRTAGFATIELNDSGRRTIRTAFGERKTTRTNGYCEADHGSRRSRYSYLTNFPVYSGWGTPAKQREALELLEPAVRNFPEKSHKWESYVSLSSVNHSDFNAIIWPWWVSHTCQYS